MGEFGPDNAVMIIGGGPEVYTIKRLMGEFFKLQMGDDIAAIKYAKESDLELVAKAKKVDGAPACRMRASSLKRFP